ncbi:MAG: DUF937 domain-containing protein [Sandaracinaceae bacterium]
MSNSQLMSTLIQSLAGGQLNQLSQQIGASPSQTQSALGAALPMLVGALAQNSSTPAGAQSLAKAIDRDHDGSVLDNLGSILGGASGGSGGGMDMGGLLSMAAGMLTQAPGPSSAKSVDGAGILGHILGGKQSSVAQGVSKASGLDMGQVTQLLILVAPMIMGALGKAKQSQGLDAGGLADMLGNESQQMGGGPGRGAGGLLGSLLDSDNDGSIADDIASMAGKQLLGSLFK